MLCPLLVNQEHNVVANRYTLFKEQAPPLLDLPDIPDSDDEDAQADAKRRKVEAGQLAVDDPERARREFMMMLQPVNGGGDVPVQAAPTVAAGVAQVDDLELQLIDEFEDPDMLELEMQVVQAANFVADPPMPMVELAAAEDVPDVCGCGAILTEGARFCSDCGAPAAATPAPVAVVYRAAMQVHREPEPEFELDLELEPPDEVAASGSPPA